MAVRGDADQIPLSHILQGLLLNGQEGVLRIESAAMKRRMRVLANGLRPLNYSREIPDLLREVVLKQKLTSESQLHNILSTWIPGTSPAGDFLIRRGIITPEVVETQLCHQLENVLLDVFATPGLKYEFSPEEDPLPHELFSPDGVAQHLVFGVNGLAMESMRRADEWTRIRADIPSANEVYVLIHRAAAKTQQLKIPVEAWKELRPYLNGEHSVSQIVEKTWLSPFEVYQSLQQLKKLGFIRPLPTESKKALAEKLRKALRPEDAAVVLRSALEDAPDDPSARLKLIALLEKDKDAAPELVGHYVRLATDRRQDAPEQCERYVRRALDLDPSSVAALTLLFELKEGAGNDREAIAAARMVLHAARSGQDREGAIGLAYKIINFYPDETFLYHELADIHVQHGEPDAAVACLKTAAEVHSRRGDTARARKTEERIAGIAARGECTEVRSVRRLSSGKARAPRSPWRFAALAGSLGVFLVLAFLIGLNEAEARATYAVVREEVQFHKKYGRLGRAKESLQWFLRSSRPSTLTAAARRNLSDVETLEVTARERAKADLERRKVKAEADFVRAKIAHKSNDLQAAGAVLEALDIEALDPKLAAEARALQKAVAEYFQMSSALSRAAEVAEKRGETAQAYQLLREVVTKYPYSPAARDVRLPVEIKSVPSGAEVSIGGEVVGKTPLVVKLGLGKIPRIRLELPGYEPAELRSGGQESQELNPLESYAAVATLTRAAEWKFDARASVEVTPVSVGDRLCLATRNGDVFMLSQADGSAAWRYTVPGNMDVSGGLKVWRGQVYFASFDGRVYSLDAASGSPAWDPIPASDDLRPIKHAPSAPTEDGRVAVNVDSRLIVGIDLGTRARVWEFPAAGDTGLLGEPLTRGSSLLVCTTAGELVELDRRTGEVGRRIKVAPRLSLPGAVCDDRYLVGTAEGLAISVDLEQGKTAWSYVTGHAITAPPFAADGSAVYALASGLLVCLSRDGQLRWSSSIGDTVAPTARASSASGQLYLGTASGQFLGIDLPTGKVLWQFATQGSRDKEPRPVLSGSEVLGGRIFFGSEDQHLYCLLQGV